MIDPGDWQTPAALLVVAITAVALVARALRQHKRSDKRACGGGCSCPVKPIGRPEHHV